MENALEKFYFQKSTTVVGERFSEIEAVSEGQRKWAEGKIFQTQGGGKKWVELSQRGNNKRVELSQWGKVEVCVVASDWQLYLLERKPISVPEAGQRV